MSYKGPVNHLFLYHAYALALGGWVRDGHGQFIPIRSVAPSVLSITGGFGSASEHNLNIGVRGKYPFGEGGPGDFYVYVGHAYTEVRGVESDDDHAFGGYKTTVRSVLDDVRINDVLHVEHAEAILMSTHPKPGDTDEPSEGEVVVGHSNMDGLRVVGKPVKLTKRQHVDRYPKFGALQEEVRAHQTLAATAGKGGVASDPWIEDLCDWHDPKGIAEGAPEYVRDLAVINQKADKHFRYSLFKSADVPSTPGVKSFKSSIEVDDFGRIFLGEVIASHGTKQLTMFRIDLGCDNCGGVGGSGGSTNGTTYPP